MSQPSYEQHDGFALIRIAGRPYERGLQHGRLLGEQIRSMREILQRDVIDLHGRGLGLALRAVMTPILLSFERRVPPELRLEMRGVAAGAGVRYWDILTFNCFDDLLHVLWLLPPMLARVPFVGNRFACSSFALLSQRTEGGRLLLGRNLDYEVANGYLAGDGAVTRALKENVVVIECQPSDGHAFTSVAWPGLVGVFTGISRAGLSLACLTSTVNGETPRGTPMPLIYRRIIQYAESLDEAELLLRRTSRTIGNNLLVASAAHDDARVFELSPRMVATRRPNDGYLTTTNHFAHPAMAAQQEGWVVPNSLDRRARLEQLCCGQAPTEEQARAFLRDTNGLAPDAGLWSCLENPGTIYSSVAEPATGQLWLRVNDHSARPFVQLTPAWASAEARVA